MKGCLNLGPNALSRVCGLVEGEDGHCLAITMSKCSSDIPHTLDETSQAQGNDSTISHLKSDPKNRKVQDQQISLEVHQEVLYRRVPVKKNGDKFQLVVPPTLISGFLHYFHDNPLGGHLGRLKL